MDLSIPRPRLAVLIDAENVPPNRVPALFDRIAGLGDASLRRAYGDFSGTALSAWKAPAHAYALTLQHCVSQAAGKNGADIALAIDAMDLLHERLFDAFCLVSSDSDFTRLALRLRERGVRVHGFGEAKTLESFRAACDRFHLLGTAEDFAAKPGLACGAGRARAPQSASKEPPTNCHGMEAPCTQVRPENVAPAAAAAVPFIERALSELQQRSDGWYDMTELGTALSKMNFRKENFGFVKLRTLLESTEAFSLRMFEGDRLRVRRRPPR